MCCWEYERTGPGAVLQSCTNQSTHQSTNQVPYQSTDQSSCNILTQQGALSFPYTSPHAKSPMRA